MSRHYPLAGESHSRWTFICAVWVSPGRPHPRWPQPLGKQRRGEPRSCLGFLRAIKKVLERQWSDLSSIGTYAWEPGVGWTLKSEQSCISSAGEPLIWLPKHLGPRIKIKDVGKRGEYFIRQPPVDTRPYVATLIFERSTSI